MLRRLLLLAAALALPALSGCAAMALPLVAGGAEGAGAAGVTSGISYTFSSGAYKTVTAPYELLMHAVEESLQRMAIRVTETTPTDTGTKFKGKAGSRSIEIELDQLTATATQIEVVAKEGWFSRDRATAAEIIVQIEKTLATHQS